MLANLWNIDGWILRKYKKYHIEILEIFFSGMEVDQNS